MKSLFVASFLLSLASVSSAAAVDISFGLSDIQSVGFAVGSIGGACLLIFVGINAFRRVKQVMGQTSGHSSSFGEPPPMDWAAEFSKHSGSVLTPTYYHDPAETLAFESQGISAAEVDGFQSVESMNFGSQRIDSSSSK